MTNNASNQIDSLSSQIKTNFVIKYPIKRIVIWQMPVSRSALVTIFLNQKNQLFAYITTPARQTLADVQKILYRVGLSPYKYCEPVNQPGYFVKIATEHFNKIFPGRNIQVEEDLRYYKTLALYNPALVQIKAVKNGVIKGFDADAKDSWRVYTKLVYAKLDDF